MLRAAARDLLHRHRRGVILRRRQESVVLVRSTPAPTDPTPSRDQPELVLAAAAPPPPPLARRAPPRPIIRGSTATSTPAVRRSCSRERVACRIVATPSGASRPRGLMASLPSRAEGLEASTTDQASPALGRSGRRTDACHSAAPLELRSPRLGCCVRTSSANGARERAAVKRSAASNASLCASSSTH